MVRTKIFEWLGLIIVFISILANGYIRSDGITTGTAMNFTVIGMILGAILTFTFFFIRKAATKTNS